MRVFFGGFADPLACWNQHEDTPLARARQELGPLLPTPQYEWRELSSDEAVKRMCICGIVIQVTCLGYYRAIPI